MECRVKPKISRTYSRRRVPKPQQSAVTGLDTVVLAVPASSFVGPIGYEIGKQNQHLALYPHLCLKLEGLQAEANRIFHKFPCRRRSKHLQKRMKKVVDSGDKKEGNMQEPSSKALQNPHQRATRKRKHKSDSIDSEDYTRSFHVRGQQKRLLDGSNSHRHGIRKGKGKADSSDSETDAPRLLVRGQRKRSIQGSNTHQNGIRNRKDKADSSDSETYAPRLRVRGQLRGSLRCSNSVTLQGMLNSEMFELYFKNIWSGIAEEKRNSFAYLDSLWFSLYTKSSLKEKVLNWIKRKAIFSKQYVLVPIVLWSHWSLLILCHFGEESKSRSPCMVLLDSLQSANHSLEPEIRKFVLDIHKVEERTANRELIRKIPFLVPKVPQQRTGEECGCYVLFYANLFLENAPESFSISEGYPYFMKEDWFTMEGLDKFRRRLGSSVFQFR